MKSKPIEAKLSAAALAILRAKIFVHEDAVSCVKSWEEIKTLPKNCLLAVARQLQIDIDDAIKQAKKDPKSDFSIIFAAQQEEGHAFSGEIEFDFEMTMLGTIFQRRAKIVYDHTPDWSYFSCSTGKERLGWDSSSFHMEIQALPEGEVLEYKNGKLVKRKCKPCWIKVDQLQEDGVLSEAIYPMIMDMIEEDARRQDTANRAKFNVQPVRQE